MENDDDVVFHKCGEMYFTSTRQFTFLCMYCNEIFKGFSEFESHTLTHIDSLDFDIEIDINPENNEDHKSLELNIIDHDDNQDMEDGYLYEILKEDTQTIKEEEDDIPETIVALDKEDELIIKDYKEIHSPMKSENDVSVENEISVQEADSCGNIAMEESNNDSIKNSSNENKPPDDYSKSFVKLLKRGILKCKCNKVFKEYKGLYEHHVQEKHCSMKTDCIICKFYSFMKAKISAKKKGEIEVSPTLKEAESVNVSKEKYQCSYCDKTFKTKYQKVYHTRVHTNERPFKCDYCSAAFTVETNLKTHVVYKHTDARPFKCGYEGCAAKFKLDFLRKNHEKTHLPNQYQCETCGSEYKTKASLRNHQISKHVDAEQWNHECDVCYKKFANKENLNDHRRIHTGERPFGCNLCNKFFRRRNALREHKKLHAEKRGYGCKICGKTFKQRAGYWGHMKRHNLQNENFKDEIDE